MRMRGKIGEIRAEMKCCQTFELTMLNQHDNAFYPSERTPSKARRSEPSYVLGPEEGLSGGSGGPANSSGGSELPGERAMEVADTVDQAVDGGL